MCDLSKLLLKSEFLANLKKSINVNVIVITEHDVDGVIQCDRRRCIISQIERDITGDNSSLFFFYLAGEMAKK